jgi:hypothetical protein
MRLLPSSISKSPTLAGATLGGADEALNADPDESVTDRALRTVGGTAGGAVLGRAAGTLATLVGGAAMPSAAATLLEKSAERARAAKALYSAALLEGQGKPATALVSKFLQEPDIADIVSDLQKTRPFQGVQANDPQILDAVYKELSDRAQQIRKGLDAATPNRANSRRFGAQDVGMAKAGALNAYDQIMPTYRTAVEDYAARTHEMNEIKRGYAAARSLTRGMPGVNQLMTTSPEALAQNLRNAAPADALSNARGVLGAVKQAPGALNTIRAANAANALLRNIPGAIGTPQGNTRAGANALLATLQMLPPGILPGAALTTGDHVAARAHSLLDAFLPEP